MTIPANLKRRLVAVYGVLALLNLGSWVGAFIAFAERPVLLSVALMVYGLGLRHAIDADHIAAIDNVTRKLVQESKRPVSVGFFFAMGHSTIVAIMVALQAQRLCWRGSEVSSRSVGRSAPSCPARSCSRSPP